MVLQSSGPISIGDIAAEFGGTAPHSLSEYYGVDSGIPESGTISISDFYGASAGIIVTIGYDSDAAMVGYDLGNIGALDPDPSYVKDARLERIVQVSWKGAGTISIWLSGNRPQNYFNTLVTEEDTHLWNATQNFGYVSANNVTLWLWSIGDPPPWWGREGETAVISFIE